MKFFLSSNPDRLAETLSAFNGTATVEAEYGDRVVEGSVLTLAHHGPRSGNPAPCLEPEHANDGRIEAVGLSHIDLDTLGGCAALMEQKPVAAGFWQLAAFVDVHGPHKLAQSGASAEDIRNLYAYWAWSETNKFLPQRDGSVSDVTEAVRDSIGVVYAILLGNRELHRSGEAFAAREAALNSASFVEESGGVIVRVSGGFTNHLYVSPDGTVARAVVALRTDFHSLTVSLADPISGVSCREIVQNLWGTEAGGHNGIAGGPRGAKMGLDELVQLRDAMRCALAGVA